MLHLADGDIDIRFSRNHTILNELQQTLQLTLVDSGWGQSTKSKLPINVALFYFSLLSHVIQLNRNVLGFLCKTQAGNVISGYNQAYSKSYSIGLLIQCMLYRNNIDR